MPDPVEVKKTPGKILLKDDEILVVCPSHKSQIMARSGKDFVKDSALMIDAGEKNCTWCKKDTAVTWPEIQAKIFTPE